jgi:hypothetical protein
VVALRHPSGLGARDRAILARAFALLGDGPATFADAVRALQQATEELIPAGRVFVVGSTPDGPIVGSQITRVGIVEHASGIRVVRGRR